MSDLIKREHAIEITWERPTYYDPLNVLTEVRERIRSLPSVEPKRGKWIDAEFEIETIDGVMAIAFGCNQCGWIDTHGNHYNYCPACGADMREEEA